MNKKKTSDNKKENIRETIPKRSFTSRFDLLNRFRHWYMGGASLTRSIFRVKAAWQTIIVIIVILCIFFMVAAVYTQSGEFVINIDSQMADDGFYLSETTDFSERLIDGGYSVCLDNFGSVNSPLNLLKDYSIDRIKIDRSFIARNVVNEEGITVLRYIIAMAKELDFTVISEGIETEAKVNQLVDLGSDLGQGYYFSKPITLREFDELNKSRLSDYYRPDEYYPTFEDYERDIDLVVQMFKDETRYSDFFAS